MAEMKEIDVNDADKDRLMVTCTCSWARQRWSANGKKSRGLSVGQRHSMIHQPDGFSLQGQLSLLDLSNHAWYYDLVPETAQNLPLIRLIDERYLPKPYYGVPRMTH